MRTTVTLDPDVERLVQDRMRDRRASFKEVLNGALREALSPKIKPKRKFVQQTHAMGLPLVDFGHKALGFAGLLDDEETLRKLKLVT